MILTRFVSLLLICASLGWAEETSTIGMPKDGEEKGGKAVEEGKNRMKVIDVLKDLEAAAGHHYGGGGGGHGGHHNDHGHWKKHGNSWGNNGHGHHGDHNKWGKKDWNQHGHGGHGGHSSHHKSGKHGNHWDDWGEKSKINKDKGHGYVKAFSWDREQGEKDKWGSKGGNHESHHEGGHGGHWANNAHGGHGHEGWGDEGHAAGWGQQGWGDLWGGLGGYGLLNNHWGNTWM